MVEHEGVYRIEVPTPFSVGPVNTYLVQGNPLTLIDTGPKTDRALAVLKERLGALGYGMGDIDRIIVTHGHVDHFGLAKRIQDLSEAEVLVSEPDAAMVAQFEAELPMRIASYAEVAGQAGVPESVLAEMEHYFGPIRSFGDSVPVKVLPKSVGASIRAGNLKLGVIPCPGHTPGMINLYWKEKRILISADHLLGDITPHIGLPVGDYGEGTSSFLRDYLESLQRVERLSVDTALPGHGPPIRDVKARISEIREHHVLRKEAIMRALAHQAKTPYEVSMAVFGNLPLSEILLGITEALAHLRLLEEEERIQLTLKGGILLARSKETR